MCSLCIRNIYQLPMQEKSDLSCGKFGKITKWVKKELISPQFHYLDRTINMFGVFVYYVWGVRCGWKDIHLSL